MGELMFVYVVVMLVVQTTRLTCICTLCHFFSPKTHLHLLAHSIRLRLLNVIHTRG